MPIDSLNNGHGGNARLRKLLDHHERIAGAIRITLSALEGSEIATKTDRAGGVLADALAIDSERRGRAIRSDDHRNKLTGRQRVHEMLEQYKPGDILPPGSRYGALVLHGYITRDADGNYIRTDKPHHAEQTRGKKKPKGAHLSTEPSDAATMSVADWMNRLAPRDEVPPGALKFGKGVLVHHGYLRKKANGAYVRTAKPYPQPASSEPETTT